MRSELEKSMSDGIFISSFITTLYDRLWGQTYSPRLGMARVGVSDIHSNAPPRLWGGGTMDEDERRGGSGFRDAESGREFLPDWYNREH